MNADPESRPGNPEATPEPPPVKPPKPFASLAQLRRYDGMVKTGEHEATQDKLDAGLRVTDVANLPERTSPKKGGEDPEAEPLESVRARMLARKEAIAEADAADLEVKTQALG